MVLLPILLLFGAAWWIGRQPWMRPHLVSPLSRLSYIQIDDRPKSTTQRRVLGYLPYWTLKEAAISDHLSDVAYFSISLQADGRLREGLNGERDLGLVRLQEESFTDWMQERHKKGQRVQITVSLFDPDIISSLVSNANSRRQAANSLAQLVASYPFDGVQLDVEYSGEVTDQLRTNYVQFVREVDAELARLDPQIELSVAMYGSAASRYTFWDPGRLHSLVDFLVVMAYDYHVRSSPVVGPVAPIFGRGAGRWEDDVVSNMRDLLQQVPADKIVLGIPFYGYEWTSTSDQPGSTTFPDSGATATYKRVADILGDPKLKAQERWDEDALAPYVTYQENGRTQFIYYENTRSLSYKLDFVEQLDLQGIAIWALGYEGGHPELWEVIGQKLRQL